MTYELAAIWLERSITRYQDGKPVKCSRIAPGDEVVVLDNAIQHETDDEKPNHFVLGCFMEGSEYSFMVIDKRSFYPQMINARKQPNLI